MDRRAAAGQRRDTARKRHYDIAAQNMERKEREMAAKASKEAFIAKFAAGRIFIIRERRAGLRFAKHKQIMERVHKAMKAQKSRRSRH